jgi:hypothetical protein
VLFTEHSLGDQIRKNGKFRHVSHTGERGYADGVLMRKPGKETTWKRWA